MIFFVRQKRQTYWRQAAHGRKSTFALSLKTVK